MVRHAELAFVGLFLSSGCVEIEPAIPVLPIPTTTPQGSCGDGIVQSDLEICDDGNSHKG